MNVCLAHRQGWATRLEGMPTDRDASSFFLKAKLIATDQFHLILEIFFNQCTLIFRAVFCLQKGWVERTVFPYALPSHSLPVAGTLHWYVAFCAAEASILMHYWLKAMGYIRSHPLWSILWVLTNAWCHVSAVTVSYRSPATLKPL